MNITELYRAYFEEELNILPYRSNDEYLADQLRFLDVCLTIACGAKGLRGGSLPDPETVGHAPSLSVSSSDLFGILEPCEDSLTPEAQEQFESAFFYVECRRRLTLRQSFTPPMETVIQRFALDDLEQFALLLAYAVSRDRKYEGIFAYLHNSAADNRASVWLAVRLYRLFFGETPPSAAAMLDGSSPLLRFLAQEESAGRLTLRGRIASFISGSEAPGECLPGFAEPYTVTEEKIPVREESFRQAESFFRTNIGGDGCAVLNLFGPEGIGRRFTAAHAAASGGYTLISADIRRMAALSEDRLASQLDTLYTECQLRHALPCFLCQTVTPSGGGEEDSAPRRTALDERLEWAASRIASLFPFVFWISAERTQLFLPTSAVFFSLELPMLSAAERAVFWNAWADRSRFAPGVEPDICASQYILTPRALRRVLRAAEDLSAYRGTPIDKEILRDAIRQHSKNQLGLYATLINAVFTWDDLIVDAEQKRKMKMICDQVRYRRIVGEEWGFRRKSPYGNGLCALFYGSPGTGKTMAVQVMANELGLDLYRIDLSQLVSKYIGETQKNISELFARAKNINAMLFFDEADSMFAKRSEVKDSNDRYANADTAFLLQKLEDYDGITILATNYVNNIDDAFKRRIKFMINFVFPEPEVRLMLWRKTAPQTARYDEAIDFEFFAEHFELTGSNIKEILTNAAYLAASEGGGIRNRHVIEAVKLNFSKYGKLLTDDDFGYLGR